MLNRSFSCVLLHIEKLLHNQLSKAESAVGYCPNSQTLPQSFLKGVLVFWLKESCGNLSDRKSQLRFCLNAETYPMS